MLSEIPQKYVCNNCAATKAGDKCDGCQGENCTCPCRDDWAISHAREVVKAIHESLTFTIDYTSDDWRNLIANSARKWAGGGTPPRDATHVIIADGEGAGVTFVSGDLHQPLHDFMCFCGKPWRECPTEFVRQDVERIDDADNWSTNEDGKPFSISWEYETGRTTVYRAGAVLSAPPASTPPIDTSRWGKSMVGESPAAPPPPEEKA